MSDDKLPDIGPKHFASLEATAAPVRAFLEAACGAAVEDEHTHKYLSVSGNGVSIRAWVYDEASWSCVEWGVGYRGRMTKVGTTPHGCDLTKYAIPAVLLAADCIKGAGRE